MVDVLVGRQMKVRSAIVFCICALTLGYEAQATVSGMALATGIAQGTGSGASRRQLVRLSASDGLLNGRPKRSIVRLVTAESAVKVARVDLILRETEFDDGCRVLFVGMPVSIQARLLRMTLYLDSSTEQLALFADREGRGRAIRPQILHVAGVDENTLSAFSIEGPGEFWLLDARSPSAVAAHEATPIGRSGTLSARARAGLWHWIWAAVALGVFWMVSSIWHSRRHSTQGD